MTEFRDVLLNALGYIESLLAVREEISDDLIEGAEIIKQQLIEAVEKLDENDSK